VAKAIAYAEGSALHHVLLAEEDAVGGAVFARDGLAALSHHLRALDVTAS